MKLRWILWISLAGLVVMLVLTWPSNKSKLIFCDVGQGDGAILTKGSTQILFDVGPENKKMVECLGRHLPFWDKTIEMVVLSHLDSDHSGGLKDVKRYYQLGRIYSNEQNNYSVKLSQYDVLSSDWFVFEILNSGGLDNDGSIMGILKIDNKNVLFTGDAGVEVERKLVWREVLRQALRGKAIDILKVSHHGSAGATSDELLEVVKPKIAVISVGKNSFGHPTKEVIDRLGKFGVEIWRTDKQGELVID